MLTKEQEDIKQYFLSFLFTDEKYLIIDGKGGTGKSYLLSSLIETLTEDAINFANMIGMKFNYTGYAVTSTTNKSVEVLKQQTSVSDDSVQTIHSFLNLVVKEDFNTGKQTLKPVKNRNIYENIILFIDESSMIDTDLFNYINTSTKNCKVIFIGDKCQLPPVKERISPIYTLGIKELTLKNVIRTSKQDLLDMNDYLRDCVINQQKAIIKCSENIVYLDDRDDKTFDWMNQYLNNQYDNNHICCYSNQAVNEYCKAIHILRGDTDLFPIGQKMIVNEAIIRSGNNGMGFQFKKTLLHTDAIVTVENVNAIFRDTTNEMNFVSLNVSHKGSTYQLCVPLSYDTYKNVLKQYAKDKNWARYYLFKETYSDLRLLDATTVHKAQGSTYNNVLIDLSDLGTCRNPEQFRRLLYVAFSRAKEKVFLTGKLPEKYGELII